ncbi:hypothetical protein [Streptomyces sp. NPDC048606]|uniref:hypothetical protein n=1 Tax=Streptomyces sp. NPDC048606 TaxID=3154726 RepID=UPI003431D7AD
MDLVHLSDVLLSHLTDLVPYLQLVIATGRAGALVRRGVRAGRRRLRARRGRQAEGNRTTAGN